MAPGENSSTRTLTQEDSLQQARPLHDTSQDSFDDLIEPSRSRLAQILVISSSHLRYTFDSLEDVQQDYAAYENVFFGKIKEGVDIAALHPWLTTGAVAGLGLTALNRPRLFLYYKTLRLSMSKESMLSRAEAKVQGLQKSIDHLQAESEKLERDAKIVEEAMIHVRTKLRQAGKQIQGVIQSAYKKDKREV